MSTVQIHPVGGGRGPAELRHGTAWQRAGTAARFTVVLLAGGVIGAMAFALLLAALFYLLSATGPRNVLEAS